MRFLLVLLAAIAIADAGARRSEYEVAYLKRIYEDSFLQMFPNLGSYSYSAGGGGGYSSGGYSSGKST